MTQKQINICRNMAEDIFTYLISGGMWTRTFWTQKSK